MKQPLILAIAALLSVAPAMADVLAIELDTPPDSRVKAWGLAQAVTDGEDAQLFQVRADLDVRDGTMLVVAVEIEDRDGVRDWYDVAFMEVQLGTASMRLDSRRDISVAFPVSYILGVRVQHAGEVCLLGTFEGLGE